MVAITPRSFCNGPYFKPFRAQFLSQMSLRRLHLLDSRSTAFRADAVLQENIIVHAVKSTLKPERVIVSISRGVPDQDVTARDRAYTEIVAPDDPEQFIHLVTDDAQEHARQSVRQLSTPLPSLGPEVSTGRVVDFRARELRNLNQTTEPLKRNAPSRINAPRLGEYLHQRQFEEVPCGYIHEHEFEVLLQALGDQ